MTDHPCKGMTRRQIEAFEQIAIGEALPIAHRRTLASLEALRLIERLADQELGRDRFGAIFVPQYQVPIPIHMQWCQWCSEQLENQQEQK